MKKNLVVKQEEIADCGVCSLLSIIRFYKGNASLEYLRINSCTTKEGVSAFNLIECAKALGFDAIGKQMKGCDESPALPIIAHLKLENGLYHFVVVYKIDKLITIMDPQSGFIKMSKQDFEKIFTGVYIELTPKIKLTNFKTPNKIFRVIKKSISSNYKNIILISFLNLLFVLLSIFYSFFVEIFNGYKVILIFLVILLVKNLFEFIISNETYKLQNEISYNLMSDFFKHIFNLPFKYLRIKEPGEIIKRTEDANTSCTIIINIILKILLSSIMIVLILTTLFFIFKPIVITLTLFIMFLFIYTMKTYKHITLNIDDCLKAETEYKTTLIDYINGINSIKYSSCINKFLKNINNLNYTSLNKTNTLNKVINKKNFLKKTLIGIFELITNSILLINVKNGSNSLEDFIIINFLLSILIDSIDSLLTTIPDYIITKNYIQKVNEFYILDEIDNKGMSFDYGDIQIKNLTYSYNQFNQVFENLNLTIKKNEHIVIKGSSGVGKSTLAKLLIKEDENYDGEISFNHINLKNISINSLKNFVAYSSQNEHIFNGTIKDNIIMNNELDENYLNKVIKICFLDRILDKRPMKLETYLYNNNELSGGEKQLIILARLLYKRAKIMILDETLSEVNEQLESDILNNILSFFKDSTIIYITHKNSKQYNMREINIKERRKSYET